MSGETHPESPPLKLYRHIRVNVSIRIHTPGTRSYILWMDSPRKINEIRRIFAALVILIDNNYP